MHPHIPENAPFSPGQRAWLNGYFAGFFSRYPSAAASVATSAAGPTVRILFGSQTGTAENLARKTAKKLTAAGCACSVHALDDVEPASLAEAARVLILTSTHGEGEMPDNARSFWEAISREDAPRLDGLRYSVLALGDATYTDFCQAGRNLDARFEALGAERLHARVDADVDFEEPFAAWLSGVSDALTASEATSPMRLAA